MGTSSALQDVFVWTESQTCPVANCSYSQALLLLPPSEHSTAQYPWLTHGTCSSPQSFLPYSKNRLGKCAGNSAQLGFQQIHVHIQTGSSSLAHTLESSNWELPKPIRLLCFNTTNFGKNGKICLLSPVTPPSVTPAGQVGRCGASRFLRAPWCWNLGPCFFIERTGNGCSAWHELPFAYKKPSSNHLHSKYILLFPRGLCMAKEPNSWENKWFCCSLSAYLLPLRQFGFPN